MHVRHWLSFGYANKRHRMDSLTVRCSANPLKDGIVGTVKLFLVALLLVFIFYVGKSQDPNQYNRQIHCV